MSCTVGPRGEPAAKPRGPIATRRVFFAVVVSLQIIDVGAPQCALIFDIVAQDEHPRYKWKSPN